jgi:hypothetical protein
MTAMAQATVPTTARMTVETEETMAGVMATTETQTAETTEEEMEETTEARATRDSRTLAVMTVGAMTETPGTTVTTAALCRISIRLRARARVDPVAPPARASW